MSKKANIPYQRNLDFTGRSQILEQLCQKFWDKPHRYNHRIALYGLGGTGKTQIALEYAYRNRHLYCAMYWISGVNRESICNGLLEIGETAGIVDSHTVEDRTAAAKKVLVWMDQQIQWLLVIDNVDDLTALDGVLPDIMGNGHTLITMRDMNANGIPAEGFEVTIMCACEATEMLLQQSDIHDIDDSKRTEAAKIVSKLGFLPLAIAQAAAFIREGLKDLSRFIPIYTKFSRELLRRIPNGNWAYQNSVGTTWLMSFEAIGRRDAGAARLLQLFAFLDPDRITLDFLEQNAHALTDATPGLAQGIRGIIENSLRLVETLFLLEQHSLIRRHQSGKVITIHRLVQSVLRDEMSRGEVESFWSVAIDLCDAAFPKPTTNETRSRCHKYKWEVINLSFKIPEIGSEKLMHLLRRVSTLLRHADPLLLVAVETLQRKAMEISKILWTDRNDDRTAGLIDELATTTLLLQQWSDTVEYHKRVAEFQRKRNGPAHERYLKAMHGLAIAYMIQNIVNESKSVEESTGRADFWNTENDNRFLLEAAEIEENNFEVAKKIFGEAGEITLCSMNTLTAINWRLGKAEIAQRINHEFEQITAGTPRREYLCVMKYINNLAHTFFLSGGAKAALGLLHDQLQMSKALFGNAHEHTLRLMYNLALVYRALRFLDEATKFIEELLSTRSEKDGEEHLETQRAMSFKIEMLCVHGQIDVAIPLQTRLIEKRRMSFGEEKQNTLCGLRMLSLLQLQPPVAVFWTLETRGWISRKFNVTDHHKYHRDVRQAKTWLDEHQMSGDETFEWMETQEWDHGVGPELPVRCDDADCNSYLELGQCVT